MFFFNNYTELDNVLCFRVRRQVFLTLKNNKVSQTRASHRRGAAIEFNIGEIIGFISLESHRRHWIGPNLFVRDVND